MERRLTSILAADVVGYSRLMGEDEAGPLTTLKAHRADLIDPKACWFLWSPMAEFVSADLTKNRQV